MVTSNQKQHEHERQYRPTYSSLPKSKLPSNFGASIPPSMQAVMRERRRTSMQTFAKNETDFHSTATVATTNSSAFASGKFSHSVNGLSTMTRIPTPTRRALRNVRSQQAVYSTVDSDSSGSDDPDKQTPKAKNPESDPFIVNGEKFVQVLPNLQRKNSEQTPKVSRLMGPINTEPMPEPSLGRSRTYQALSSITNSFSLNILHKASSQLSMRSNPSNTVRSSSGPAAFVFKSSRPGSPTPESLGIEKPEGDDLREVRTSMPPSYWAGRYRTIHDKLRTKDLDSEDSHRIAVRDLLDGFAKEKDPFIIDDGFSASDELRDRLAFTELRAHCTTVSAKKSLWSFQQAYARDIKCRKLLPAGGTMEDKENILSRAGRFFIKRSGTVLSDKRPKGEKSVIGRSPLVKKGNRDESLETSSS